ncbi:hypothetical protein [Streptomyces clavifer]
MAAAHVRLDPAVLDRIDEVVMPGTANNPADSSILHPALRLAAVRP